MQILKKQPTVKAPAETFTGDAWYDVIARGLGDYVQGTRLVYPMDPGAMRFLNNGCLVRVAPISFRR